MRKFWTEQELDYLLAAIHGQTVSQIANHLNRSERSIKNKLNKLGVKITDVRKKFLTKRDDLWTKEQVNYLINNAGKNTSYKIAKDLNKTNFAVKEKARRLNVSLQINPWSYKDVDLLEKLVQEGKTWIEIGNALDRTPNSCRRKYSYVFK